MAGQDATGKDPHLGFRFWIELGQIEVAGFTECSGLKSEIETFEYMEGGLNSFTHKLPVRAKYSNITLKRHMDEHGGDIYKTSELYTWYQKIVSGKFERKNISIIIYNSIGTEIQRWNLQNAFPCKWSGPDLSTQKGAIAIETVELAHEGLIQVR
jgi:phage tail-like protein